MNPTIILVHQSCQGGGQGSASAAPLLEQNGNSLDQVAILLPLFLAFGLLLFGLPPFGLTPFGLTPIGLSPFGLTPNWTTLIWTTPQLD